MKTDPIETLALFTEQLSTLHHISLTLSRVDSFDEMCRQAVIAWRNELKFDRIGIWFVCPHNPNHLCGSFGLDEHGQVRDERSQSIRNPPIYKEILNNQERVYYAVNQDLLNDRSETVGHGETAAAALWDGHVVIGFVVIDNLLSQQPITTYQRDILYLFGQMVGHLASQKRAEKTIRESERRNRIINEITYAAITEPDFRGMLQSLVDRFAELLEAQRCYLTLWDEINGEVLGWAASGFIPGETIPLPSAEQIRLTRSILESGNSILYRLDSPTHCCLALPLIANQQRLGAIFVEKSKDQAFSDFEIQTGEAAAGQIALAILKARLLDQTELRLHESETLRLAGIAVAAALKQEDAIERILEQLNRVVPYDRATVQLRRGDIMEVVGVRGTIGEQAVLGQVVPLTDASPSALAVERQTPCILTDAPAEYPKFQAAPHLGIRGWMGVPILLQGQVIGMLTLGSTRPGSFTPEHARLATAFAAHVAITLENARLFDEVQRLATHDYLTGIYNRRHFMELARQVFARARRYGEDLAIIMIDVDRFKSINDTYGHLVGDLVLQKIAQTCQEQLRASDIIGRYGGEEFIVLLPNTTTNEISAAHEPLPAFQIAERLRKSVEALVISSERGEIRVTISLGVAGKTSNTDHLELLTDHADRALMEAKSAGRNRVMVAGKHK